MSKIRLTEAQLHRVIKETVKTILREQKDTTFIEVKRDAEEKFNKIMSYMEQIGCPFDVKFICGRDENGNPHIGAEMDAHQIKSDHDLDYYWKTLALLMKKNDFVLNVGPVMGYCEWYYNDKRMYPMWAKHNERFDARLSDID